MRLRGNVVTRRVSEENAPKSSLTRRVTKLSHLLLAALAGRREPSGASSINDANHRTARAAPVIRRRGNFGEVTSFAAEPRTC